MSKRFAMCAFLLVLPSWSAAHRDVLIPIASDGSLQQLPNQYQPAKLEVRFDRGNGTKGVSFVRLTIGKRITSVPACVLNYLPSEQASEVRAKGSWYHQISSLPPYLHVDFFEPGFDPKDWANSGYSLLFNLDTGQLIRMDVNIARATPKSIQSVPVDIRQICPARSAMKLDR